MEDITPNSEREKVPKELQQRTNLKYKNKEVDHNKTLKNKDSNLCQDEQALIMRKKTPWCKNHKKSKTTSTH